jgi:hypothetical protein
MLEDQNLKPHVHRYSPKKNFHVRVLISRSGASRDLVLKTFIPKARPPGRCRNEGMKGPAIQHNLGHSASGVLGQSINRKCKLLY